MVEDEGSAELIEFLNRAVARELQVSVQYMLQHSIWVVKAPAKEDSVTDEQRKFVGTHFPFWLPGTSLKKIAITEMRHAEAIAERIVRLGGGPTSKPDPITISKTVTEILEINKEVERGAIELYKKIIEIAERENDEENHFQTFSNMLKD